MPDTDSVLYAELKQHLRALNAAGAFEGSTIEDWQTKHGIVGSVGWRVRRIFRGGNSTSGNDVLTTLQAILLEARAEHRQILAELAAAIKPPETP